MCHTPACMDCTRDAKELQYETVLMSHMGYTYTVVGTQESMEEAVEKAIDRTGEEGVGWDSYLTGAHKIQLEHFCQSCFPNHGPIMGRMVSHSNPEWVGRSVMDREKFGRHKLDPEKGLAVTGLVWENVPQPDSACTCPEFNPACEASVHLVRVECMLVRGVLRVFAWIPLSLRGGSQGDDECLPYLVDILPPRIGLNHCGLCQRSF